MAAARRPIRPAPGTGEPAPVVKATAVSVEEWRAYRYGCPLEAALDALGGRWKGAILYLLLAGPRRYRDLHSRFPAVTPYSLAVALRGLERDGVISRRVFPTNPPQVEYALTERGRRLVPVLRALEEWGQELVDAPGQRAASTRPPEP